jgi:prevent-host-death family protein
MREVAISEFKAKCLALLAQVEKTKTPIRITRRGRVVAEVVPASPVRSTDWMGSMKDRIQILGDIISPASDESDWEVFRD